MAEEDPQVWRMEMSSIEVPRHLVDPTFNGEEDLARERRVHMCRCLLVATDQGDHPYTTRCPVMLPVDQPLCGQCERNHITGEDWILGRGEAYMMLVPPEIP
jgi:hypothetical protein